jgi:hypothetical protein
VLKQRGDAPGARNANCLFILFFSSFSVTTEDTEFLSEQTEFVMSYMRRSKSMLMEALGQTAGKLDV